MKVLKKIFPLASAFAKSTGMFVVGIILHVVALILVGVLAVSIPLVISSVSGVINLLLDLILMGLATTLGIFTNAILWIICLSIGGLIGLYFLVSFVMLFIFFFTQFKLVPADKESVETSVDTDAEVQ